MDKYKNSYSSISLSQRLQIINIFYAMVSPEGKEMWQLQQYTSITPTTNFKYTSVFANKDEKPDLPGSDWDLTSSYQNRLTKRKYHYKK